MADFSNFTSGAQDVDSQGILCNSYVDAAGLGNCDAGFDPTTGINAQGQTYAGNAYGSSGGGGGTSFGGPVAGPGSTGVSQAGLGGIGTALEVIPSWLKTALTAAGVDLGTQAGASLISQFFNKSGGLKKRATHLNRSTYTLRSGKTVPKGTKQVTNRRSNAGNAKAVRRAMRRVAMFGHLASKVEAQLRHVARRVHHTRGRSVRRR